jgi:hypothetical protein
MKLGLPKGWFARILLGGWALLILGVALAFVSGSLVPRAFDLVTPLWVLSIFLALGTFAYTAAFAVRRFWDYLRRFRNDSSFTLSPVERILVAGWIVFVLAALASLPLSRYRWVQTFGPEVLFFIFALVLLASSLYGSYVLIRLARERLSRR